MMTTQTAAAASARILSMVHNGTDVIDALKAVCGVENVDAMIDSLYHELRVREGAARHLKGIPASQNAASIDSLYDGLNTLHIARIESRDDEA